MKVKTNGKLPHAWVVSPKDKGRKKIYNDNKIYLTNGDEFEIELYNPTPKNVLALISLDGKPISKSGIVVRAGERWYLDCFYDDQKKFVFETYNVEDTDEAKDAISKNGMLEIFFYEESIADSINWPDFYETGRIKIEEHHHHHYPHRRYYPWQYEPWGYPNIFFGTTTTGTTNLSGVPYTFTTDGKMSFNCTTNAFNVSGNVGTTTGVNLTGSTGEYKSVFDSATDTDGSDAIFSVQSTDDFSGNVADIASESKVETGQTNKGESSNQKFKEIEMDFEEKHIANICYALLPESRKPMTSSDVSKSSISKISDKVSDSPFITDLAHRLHKFNDLLTQELIEQSDFDIIKEKTTKSMIRMSSEMNIENIDDLSDYMISFGELVNSKLLSEDDFKVIKTNLFNSIK